MDGACPSVLGNMTFEGTGVYLGNSVYATSIPGIGYKIHTPLGANPVPVDWPKTLYNRYQSMVYEHIVVIDLVKTGSIGHGGTLSGEFARWAFAGKTYFSYQFTGSITVKPMSPTCTVTTPSIVVPFGNISKTVFSGVGSTSGSRSLNIRLLCKGGDAGTSTPVHVTLTDATNPANRTTSLSLTTASTAGGVAIQLLKDNVVLGYGADSDAADNANRWSAGASAASTNVGGVFFDIPLTARYVQTGTVITPGSANGKATFTMSYQ